MVVSYTGPTDAIVENGKIVGIGEKRHWPFSQKETPKYTKENLIAEMRAIDPEKYGRCQTQSFPDLVVEMLSWAAYKDYKGSLELSRKLYGNLYLRDPPGFYFEE